MNGIIRRCGTLAIMVVIAASSLVAQRHAPPRITPDRSGMVNLGELLLPPDVGGLYNSSIDPFNSRAYVGVRRSPALVTVSIHGALPKVVQKAVPSEVPQDVPGLVMRLVDTSDGDPRKHYVYATEVSNQILKIAPSLDATHPPQVVAVLRPASLVGQVAPVAIDTRDSDPALHYAYFRGRNADKETKILRVRLSDFSEQGIETLPADCHGQAAIDTVRHYVYFAGGTGNFKSPGPLQICKVNLATFHDGGTGGTIYTMGSTTPGDGVSRAGFGYPGNNAGFVIDEVHGYGYIGTANAVRGPDNDKWPNNQSMIIQVKLGEGDVFPPHPLKTLDLRVGERGLSAGVFDPAHGDVYFGTDNTYPAHIYMVHVGDGTQPMSEVGRLDLNMGSLKPDELPHDGDGSPGDTAEQYGEAFIRSAILDTQQHAIYFGTDSKPAQLVKVGIQGYLPQPKTVQDLARRIEAALAPLEHVTDRPGVAVEVIDHGKVILNKGYGMANLETKAPITPDTQFLLASCSKQFTAMGIMILQQRGKLHYDDAITQYFPEFPEYARKITIRNLLNHTGGLPEYGSEMEKAGKVENSKGNWPRAANTPPSAYEPTSHETLEFLATLPAPLFPAGEKFQYSNSGYVVLAQIIEKVSGMRFAEFVQQNIFRPLGMKDSYVYDERKQHGHHAAASYTFSGPDPDHFQYVNIDYTPINFIYGEDNVITTLNDMAKWAQGLDENKLLPASALAEGFTRGHLNTGAEVGYGFGWFLPKNGDANYQYHTGSWLGFRTYIGRSKGLTVIMLSNCGRVHVFMPARLQKLPEQLPGVQGMFEEFLTSAQPEQ